MNTRQITAGGRLPEDQAEPAFGGMRLRLRMCMALVRDSVVEKRGRENPVV
jgi:hypothetical protein